MNYQHFQSPIGELILVERSGQLAFVVFGASWEVFREKHLDLVEASSELLGNAKTQLSEYFEGRRKSFQLPLSPQGTEFQRRVWDALLSIPFGETRSYSEQALRLNQPKAVRAVGHANGQNPLPVLIPCHRVLGKDGSLTGFAGGTEMKRQLLALEGIVSDG